MKINGLIAFSAVIAALATAGAILYHAWLIRHPADPLGDRWLSYRDNCLWVVVVAGGIAALLWFLQELVSAAYRQGRRDMLVELRQAQDERAAERRRSALFAHMGGYKVSRR